MSKLKKRQFDVLTIFPDMITGYASQSILGRAEKKGVIAVAAHDLRDWTTDKHRSVDDSPYGGGPGMVMKVEVFERAVRELKKAMRATRATKAARRVRVILTSASGKLFTQKDAKRLAKYDQLIFLCGRYEGVDARVEEHVADESLSIGEYVLTGGELPALVMIDAIARHIPGVLGKKESLAEESHDEQGVLEYPQFTKPESYSPPARVTAFGGIPSNGGRGARGGGRKEVWNVPPVLLSGNHKLIEEWRKKNQKQKMS
jgi:tRNA (guanine37-N1)-methyltransferase